MVEWTRRSGEDIAHVIAMLLCSENPSALQIRPSQGDGGIDVRIPQADGSVEIVQVKKFATNLTAGQKRQIRNSFDKIKARAADEDWRVSGWRLMLPLDGPALVYDGHDFYSHHRRIPIDNEFARQTGLSTNPVRYANDWTPVGPDGKLSRGPLESIQEWYGYGARVHAPATGVVVSVANDVGDNRVEDGRLRVPEEAPTDELKAALGNHLIIRHRPDEYTLLAHLRAGTVRAAVGDTVHEGQEVGEIGFSGDTGYHVHLHQMLLTAPTFSAEGLPSYFDGVQRIIMGTTPTPLGPVQSGLRLDTGDLVMKAPRL